MRGVEAKVVKVITREWAKENPEKVRVYLNELVQQYLDFGLFVKNEIAKNTLEFVSSELNRVGDTLRAIETNLADFRSDKMILDVSMKAQKYYEQITELERQLTSLEIERNYINYIEDYLRGDQFQDDPVIPMTLGDGTSQKIIDQLAELESRKASLGITASEANPVLKNMNEQIGYLKSRLREAMKGVEERNSARIAKLQKELRNLESNLSELPEQEMDLLNIERQFKLNENLFVFLMEKKAEAGIAIASNRASSTIIDYARTERNPIFPNKPRVYIVALILGLFIPIAVMFIRNFLNNKIQSISMLEGLTKIPVLGAVGHNNKNTNLTVAKHPKSAASENFRALRSNLKFMGAESSGSEKGVAILITSSIGGEGKTYNSINLASAIALSNQRTVLVGLDLRKPKIYNDFDLSNEKGVSSYLAGRDSLDEIIQTTSIKNLDLISAGPVPPNPSELILGERCVSMMETLKEKYDYIIFDTPPVGLVADAFDIIQFVKLPSWS